MFQSLVSFVAVILSVLLFSCSKTSDQAGIEIGNPEIQAHSFLARFVVDYELEETDSPEPAVAARMALESDSVLIDDLSLSLWRLSAYSSYYIYVGFDLAAGLTLWPEYSSDAPMSIAFAEDSAEIREDWKAAFGDIEIDESGLLKEVGARFAPVVENPQMAGKMKIAGSYVPFTFSFAGLDSLEVRYMKNQLDFAADGAVSLTVRFCVPKWVGGLPMTTAEAVDDTVRFDALHNKVLWDSLTARFSRAFSAAHRLTYYSNGVFEDEYDANVLARYDVIDSNWVSNGNFADHRDWILVQQLGGLADTSISNNEMTVTVSSAGTQNYSVQLIHEDIPLLQGRRYKLIFTAIADSEAPITVRLGSYNTYDTEAFQKQVDMDMVWKSYEFEYTALVDDLFARLEFNLGKNLNRYQFKDVKIYRID